MRRKKHEWCVNPKIIHLRELVRLWDGAQVRRKGEEGGRCSCHFTVQRRVTAGESLLYSEYYSVGVILAATRVTRLSDIPRIPR